MFKRVVLFLTFILTSLGALGYIYWQQELQYILPTPVPENLVQVDNGDTVGILPGLPAAKKPRFIHFYNFDCPCSRFNIRDFQQMVHKYEDRIEFIAIIQDQDHDPDLIRDFKEKYDLGIRVFLDSGGDLARTLGVYSTPQAVLVDQNQVIYYKGNYNVARFCSSRSTAFAEIALQYFTEGKEAPFFPEQAYVAYGCTLPSSQETNPHDLLTSFIRTNLLKIDNHGF